MRYLINRNKALMALQRAEIVDVIKTGTVDLPFKRKYDAANKKIQALMIDLNAARSTNSNLREKMSNLQLDLDRAQLRIKRGRRKNTELREQNSILQLDLDRHRSFLQRLRGLGQPGLVPKASARPRPRTSV